MKTEELQRAADRNDMKGFYSGLKEVWGPQTKQPVHLKSSDGLEIIVTIYKKGDRTECGNYRGISLISAAGKIFAPIPPNRLSSHITPEVVPETQCGFRSNRSTVDMILCLRQLQEKCIEQDRPLYIVFVDFTKAFDTVGRDWTMAATEEIWMP